MISYLQSVSQVMHTGHLCPCVRARVLRGPVWMPVDHYLPGEKSSSTFWWKVTVISPENSKLHRLHQPFSK